MPFGGHDWLALTQEPTLEPELPICDPHHHFWDRRLQSLPYQRYLLDELHADIYSGHNVRSTVFLEARAMYRPDGPVELRPVGEVEFVQGLAAASASGILRPQSSGRRHHRPCRLEARGPRGAGPGRVTGGQPQPVSGHPAQRHLESRPRSGQPGERGHPGRYATFREGAQVLSHKGLSLDVMIAFPQMPEVADFARAVPDLPIILNHIGALNRVGMYANREDEVRATWRAGITAVAACPNITLKLCAWGCPAWGSTGTPGGAHRLGALPPTCAVDAVLY